MVRFVHGLLVVLAVAALTFASGALSQALPNLPVPVHAVANYATPSGLQSTVTFDARGLGGASNAGYYSKPVLVSNNTLAGVAKGLARRTVPALAFSAAIAAAGWAIDELTKQVMDGVYVPAEQAQAGMWVYYPNFAPTMRFWQHSSACAHYTGTMTECTYMGLVAGGGHKYRTTSGGQSFVVYPLQLSQPAYITGTGTNPAPVANNDLANLIKDNPATWNDALHNPDGSVNRNPDVVAAAQELADALHNPDPAQQPDPAAEWDTGNQYGDEPAPTAGDLPAACEWFPKLCEWLDWTKQDPLYVPAEFEVQQLPVTDPLADAPTWNSGLGNGSCPAARSVETFVGTVEIPFDIFCGLAELLRGLVLAAAYLTAAYILLGVNRG